jgi:hypothetical protein
VSPLIIGVFGRGLVGDGAVEMLESFHLVKIDPKSLLSPDFIEGLDKSKAYYTILSRNQFLNKKGSDTFNEDDFKSNPD